MPDVLSAVSHVETGEFGTRGAYDQESGLKLARAACIE
jgi:hypothetical protein